MPRADTTHGSKRKKRLLITLLISFAVFIFVVLPAAALTGLWLSERQKRAERPSQVTVPNVVGQDYRKAEAMLKERGLGIRVLARRSDQNQRMDVVLYQVPFGGESVNVGYTIGVTLGDFRGDKSPSPK